MSIKKRFGTFDNSRNKTEYCFKLKTAAEMK